MKRGPVRKSIKGLESWAVIEWRRFYRDKSWSEADETGRALFWEFTGFERAFREAGEYEAMECARLLSEVANVRPSEGVGV